MEMLQNIKQVMQTNKMAFDYNYTMMMAAYEQNKLMMHTLLNQSNDVPQETRDAIDNWLQGYRKGCENLKKITDDGYDLIEKSMASIRK